MTDPLRNPTLHRTYERAAARWWADRELDARFGTDLAAASLAPMRSAWAALVASKVA